MSKDSKRIIATILIVTLPIWIVPTIIALVFFLIQDTVYWLLGVEE